MSVDVKICGLSTAETVTAALDAGADYIGLVFFAPSPRNVAVADAARLAELARGRSKIVALFVDPDDALLDAVLADVRPDVVQFHGSETVARLAEIRERTDALIIKAIKVATPDDVAQAERYQGAADLILFDAKAPAGAAGDPTHALPGGNGAAFDWSLLAGHDTRQAWMLSGGLDVGNVAKAIRATGARAVDVSSGVERGKGVKDVDLIAAFVATAKSGSPRKQETSGAMSDVDVC